MKKAFKTSNITLKISKNNSINKFNTTKESTEINNKKIRTQSIKLWRFKDNYSSAELNKTKYAGITNLQ